MPKFTKYGLGILLITVFLITSGSVCNPTDSDPIKHNITVTAGTGGNISPTGTVTVNDGSSLTFTITPNTGYSITNVKVDGSSVGAVATYTFANVTANHVIEATFASVISKLTIQPGSEGKDTVVGTVYYQNGSPNIEELPNGGWGDYYYDFFEFDLTGSPSSSLTVKAELWFYASAPNDPAIQINRITQSWTEAGVTLSNIPTSVFYKNMPLIPSSIDWVTIDITDLYKSWKDGTFTNYGIKLTPTQNNHTNGSIYSSDNSDTVHRPKLVISYVP